MGFLVSHVNVTLPKRTFSDCWPVLAGYWIEIESANLGLSLSWALSPAVCGSIGKTSLAAGREKEIGGI